MFLGKARYGERGRVDLRLILLIGLAATTLGWAHPGWAQTQGGFGSSPSSSSTSGSGSSSGSDSTSGGSSGSSSSSTSGQLVTAPAPVSQSAYQGSVANTPLTPGVRSLSLQDAITEGLRNNLGLILSGQNVSQAGGQKLQQLQKLLPTVTGDFREAAQQTNLRAQGLSFPGFPSIIGPFGYTDVRGSLNWSLFNLPAFENYLATKHNFQGSRLSLEDSRELVVLAVGSSYLVCISDESRITNDQAQVATTKLSLDQAVANHEAGTSPQIDVLRARVDYQTQQQALIQDQNAFDKDKIALARTIGLPLEQKFVLTDQVPFAPLDNIDPATAMKTAHTNRRDFLSLQEQAKGAKASHTAARAERLPTVAFAGDYGDIGQTLGHSHGTFDATGTASVPIFEEGRLRGDAKLAKAQLDTVNARLSDLNEQINADVRDSLLDLQSAAQQVEVARSNVLLANESLVEAQERFVNGVADNLPVTQAQASVAQANSQYVSSLYQHNLAKLELARALGVVQAKVTEYLGGK
ncbi:MAG: TolC family protein [Acidobacteriaceae bacterium]